MTRDDKPTTPQLALELDQLTGDEVELLAGICDALVRKERPIALGHTRTVLERVALKLQAHRRKEPGA